MFTVYSKPVGFILKRNKFDVTNENNLTIMADEEIYKKWPRLDETQSYLKQHKIMELFDNMTGQLIYHRPANAREFLINFLDKLQVSKKTHLDYPCLFDDANVDSIFGMLDPTKQGFITLQQYREALETLGIQHYDLHPAGGDIDQIPPEAFKREAKRGLEKLSSTFSS